MTVKIKELTIKADFSRNETKSSIEEMRKNGMVYSFEPNMAERITELARKTKNSRER